MRQRRRTALSVLGVAVGVAAVVFLTALGEGARRYVMEEFSSLGANFVFVTPGRTETSGFFPGSLGAPNDLTLADAAALARGVREARSVVPLVMGLDSVGHAGRRRETAVLGTSHAFLQARDLTVAAGSFLPEGDLERGAPVAVLGVRVADELFPDGGALGKVVRLGDWRMRVIGLLEGRGHQVGLDLDESVIVPVASAMRLFDRSSLYRILVELEPRADRDAARQRILDILIERHDEEDVTVVTEESVVASLSRILTRLTLAVAAIGAISLAVAGLGVMNLMLVSVSERTREVGLLKAVGATRAQVLAIFLTEAVLLSVAGGLCGVAVGFVLVQGFVQIYPSFPAAPPLWAVVSVLVVTVVVGLVFGVMPARRATNLDPVAALAGR